MRQKGNWKGKKSSRLIFILLCLTVFAFNPYNAPFYTSPQGRL